jgi:hypothetical protein
MSKTQEARREVWRELIAKQQQSGLSVRAFCPRHGTSEHGFYHWRKRLADELPMRFALVETAPARQHLWQRRKWCLFQASGCGLCGLASLLAAEAVRAGVQSSGHR